MTVNKSFVMLVSLLTSGFLLCSTYDISEEEARELRRMFPVDGKDGTGRGPEDRGVGIHLGTTYSSVAVFKHPAPKGFCFPLQDECSALSSSDIIEVVKNEQGSTTTPSCVAFTDSEVLIGEPAKDQALFNSERTICGINRLLGKRFDDPDVQVYIKTLPYKVVNKKNKPHVEVKFKNGETKFFSSEDICALILGKMKQVAEAYMGNEIGHAAILVHPSFYYYKGVIGSVEEAAKTAGFGVVHVQSSRSAAAFARSLWPHQKARVLVYSLGGSGFDVSLRDWGRGWNLNLNVSRGAVDLGGQTFDTRVVEYFISLIKNKYNKDISNDLITVGKLRIECEKAKISLSRMKRVTVEIDGFEEPLTRETFEDLNMDLFNKTIDLVKDVMNEGGIEKSQLDDLILVGGNARIPKIQQMLKELLGREPLNDVSPEEAVAFAATHAVGFYIGKSVDARDDVKVANTLGLGIETIGGIMTHYANHNRPLPTYDYRFVTTSHDGQTTIHIRVFEGERSLTKYCRHLGTIELSNLPPAPRGEHIIKVTMEVALNWDFRVTVAHEASNNTKTMTIPAEQRYIALKKMRQVIHRYSKSYEEDIKEWTKIVVAMKRLMPQDHSMKFAVVNTRDFEYFFGYHRIFSNATGPLKYKV